MSFGQSVMCQFFASLQQSVCNRASLMIFVVESGGLSCNVALVPQCVLCILLFVFHFSAAGMIGDAAGITGDNTFK